MSEACPAPATQAVVLGQPGPYRGHCWTVIMPLGSPIGSDPEHPRRSTVRLLEDGVELAAPYTAFEDIARHGAGRYSHWGRQMFFSSSDNSDPRINGRRYEVAIDSSLTVYSGPEADQAAYAVAVAQGHIERFEKYGIDVGNSKVLEIGPGGNLGAQLLMADLCAEMIVADRFLTRWKDSHDTLYRCLLAGCGREAPHLEQALAQRSVEGVLTTYAEPAEALTSLPDHSVDVVVSNAVLEHVEDIRAALVELRRVSRPGAWHFHQIDLRDHRLQEKPLEHLLLTELQFHEVRVETRFDCGCQWRFSDVLAAVDAARMEVVEVRPNLHAEADYFADLLPRLRASKSPYAKRPEEDLRVLGVFLILRTPLL